MKQGKVRPDEMVSAKYFFPELPVPSKSNSWLDYVPVVSGIRAGLSYWEAGDTAKALLFFGLAAVDALTIGKLTPALGIAGKALVIGREAVAAGMAFDDIAQNGLNFENGVQLLLSVTALGTAVGMARAASRRFPANEGIPQVRTPPGASAAARQAIERRLQMFAVTRPVMF
jgi:hypothetical protein